jgi:hypothetical protein
MRRREAEKWAIQIPALIETPLQAPRGSAPLHIKNDFAIHDFIKPP